jgi:hypothetical protein
MKLYNYMFTFANINIIKIQKISSWYSLLSTNKYAKTMETTIRNSKVYGLFPHLFEKAHFQK